MSNTYYAAVDKDGEKNIFLGLPERIDNWWTGDRAEFTRHLHGFIDITWDDAPVEVELIIKAKQ